MEPDRAAGAGISKGKGVNQAFHWVSSSPSPAVVARLEACFPEIVQIPVPLLEAEMVEWHQRAIIARSYLRWVPVEGFIREFRRAGISGRIDPIPLANRCCIFRFEDPRACEAILSRPWVINGQITGMEAWSPQFIPGDSSVSSALVWIRLPSLPMEFWQDSILSAIVGTAGEYCGMDAATKTKNRGNFARVAVRLDLRNPLRPGTRLQGFQDPFWQPFSYEAMEGVCPDCASLHLSGGCLKVQQAEVGEADSGPVFGPWLVALRQRKSGSSPSSAPMMSQGESEQEVGWKSPVKLARRRSSGNSSRGGAAGTPGEGNRLKDRRSGDAPGGEGKFLNVTNGKEELVTVPVTVHCSAGSFKASAKSNSRGKSSDNSSMDLSNPFAPLSIADVGQGSSRAEGPGPLKRARPVDTLPPRSIPKPGQRKGKGKGVISKGCSDLMPTPVSISLGPVVPELAALDGSEIGGSARGQVPVSGPVAPVDADALVVVYGDQPQLSEGDTRPHGGPSDSFMIEDRDGIPSSSL